MELDEEFNYFIEKTHIYLNFYFKKIFKLFPKIYIKICY